MTTAKDLSNIASQIKGLSADSRAIGHGYLFAALPGVRFDGRDFIEQAVLNGASHIIAPMGTKFPDGVIGIESETPRHDFALICRDFYQSQPNNIVAITGTNGKTSTADFIRQIFEIAHYKSASLGTLGLISKTVKGENKMTTPDPVKLHALLADLKAAGVDYLSMEASSHGLDQARLDGVNLSVAAFTNLTQDHLDYHKTMDDYFIAKNRLFDRLLPNDGVAVVNIDDPWGLKINHDNIITFGRHDDATLKLVSQKPHASGQHLRIDYQGTIYNVGLPLIGLFQAYNVLCATGCCLALGMDADFVFESLHNLAGVAGRMQHVVTTNNKTAYIDYAHTPDALEQVLTALRPHVAGRLICVFGAGGDRDKGKRPQMGRIAQTHADIVIITDDNPRTENPQKIRDEIFSACSMAENIGDRRAAIAHGANLLNAGDVLLVAGKGHEQGQIIGDITHNFDDFIETKQAMEALEKHE